MLGGTLELLRDVMAGPVENERGVSAGRDVAGDLGQVQRHDLGVGGRHDEGGRGAPFGADGAEPIGPFIPLVARGSQGRVPRLAQTRVNVPCWPKRASSWSQISSGAPLAASGSRAQTTAAKSF